MELVGLLIPFVTAPKMVRGKFVRLFIDNTNVIHAWEKKLSRGDSETSAVIRALHVIEARLECKIFVEYMRRCSTPMAALADRLTRETSTTDEDRRLSLRTGWHAPHGAMAEWLKDPRADWTLGEKLVAHIETIL